MSNTWKITKNDLSLSPDCIDLWRIDLNREDDNIFMHAQNLSKEENARADKYISGKKSREFIITRSTLRNILGHLLKTNPRKFEFTYTKHGMPRLSPDTGYTEINFNVSHSYDFALIAITLNQPVGIDIEKIRTDIDFEKLAARFFSEKEYTAIMTYEDQKRLHAFFATWTRKEAIVKAVGTGIASGLKSFDVSVDPIAPAKLIETRWNEEIFSDWNLTTIDTSDEYFASMATNSNSLAVRYWTMT
ncbi:MAG: 4'-phosphopantetheinyl transferase [Gammaproteobacteria bacterium]|jgi:4'-phosphopantetheinyl transferase